MVEIRSVPSLSATTVSLCEPWAFVPAVPEAALQGKDAFTAWAQHPDTQHCFYNGSEGVNPKIRCNKQNPIRRLHALIADYDIPINDEMAEGGLRNCPADMRPSWLSTTL